MPPSAGSRFRAALDTEKPLQIAGCINAYAARMAERAGFRALYLSGGGVAAASLGVPDLAISTLDDVLVDLRRITDITDLPLLVDADTGFGGVLNIGRTVKSLIKAGAGALHIEDQVQIKRCGHLPGKAVVGEMEMVERIGAAVDARTDPDFVIMARTDALAVEGLQAAINRACAYVEAGADMIFPEAVTDLETYRQFAAAVGVPILANITEFGATPLYTVEELAQANVSLVLYPLSAFRAMSAAALTVYRTIRAEGSQKSAVPSMQTRAELYEFLDYHAYDEKLNLLFKPEKPEESENE
ncbi:MAG TPA: methylisocitrate lyase [Nitrosospira sp.]|nr:methylisocitrate lyase [Nitrosospira sp.]